MANAGRYPNLTSTLDKEIARLALLHARDLVAGGSPSEEAARIACQGAWAEWRDWVCAVLSGKETPLSVITNPNEAAAILAAVYRDRAKAEALRRANKAETEAETAFWCETASLI